MFLVYSIVFVIALLTGTDAVGIGKAWEVSPVKNTDRPLPLLPWPRMETSAFEVRSISGVGRRAPSETLPSPFETERRTDSHTEIPEVSTLEWTTPLRESRELEDLDGSNVYISEVLLRDPMVEGFFRKAKDVEDVEALPSLWQKFRRHGRTGRNHGHCSEVEEIDEPSVERAYDTVEKDSESVEKEAEGASKALETMEKEDGPEVTSEKPRVRREADTELEKIVTSKNLREARQNAPDSWPSQPLSVEYRHQTKLEKAGDDKDQSARSSTRGLQAPHADFVTANRRSFTKTRESRDLPLAADRTFDIGIPSYRNTLRDRDLDAPYSRGLFYPDRYRTERDYFVRGLNEPTYPQDRYHEADLDRYGRSRPAPKQKRIIYYATLPEVVRKPVDLRSYPRPYDTLTRSTNPAMAPDGYYKRRAATVEPTRYRYYSYPHGSNYENYDLYAKRPWNERHYEPYAQRIEAVRRREQDLDHASMKDASRTEESMLELGHDRKMPDRVKPREHEQLLWPVKIGTELTVKDNERISGRKIFGQHDDYNRFRNNARMDRDRESVGTAENRD